MRPRIYHRNTARRVQRNAGNAQPFFQPAPAEGERGAEGGFFAASPTVVQAQLTVGQPGDRYEQEADAMADRVVGMSPSSAPAAAPAAGGAGQGLSSVQRSTPKEEEKVQRADIKEEEKVQRAEMKEEDKIQRAAKPEEEEQVQRADIKEDEKVQRAPQEEKDKPMLQAFAPGSGGGTTVGPSMAARINSSRGGGSPLPAPAQQEMSGSFGHDFSTVRIHTDSEAASLSDGLGAHAFTLGQDVYFNRGKFNPDTRDGKRLLAHELTHVVQQNVGDTLRLKSVGTVEVKGDIGMADLKTLRDKMLTTYLGIYLKRDAKTAAQARVLRKELLSLLSSYHGVSEAEAESILSTFEKNDYNTKSLNPTFNKAKIEADRFFRVLEYVSRYLFAAAKKMAFDNFKGFTTVEYPTKPSAFDMFLDIVSLLPTAKGAMTALTFFAKKLGRPIKVSAKLLREYQDIKAAVVGAKEYGSKALGIIKKIDTNEEEGDIEFKLDFYVNTAREILWEDVDKFVKVENSRKLIEDLLIELQYYRKIDLYQVVISMLGKLPDFLESESIKKEAENVANRFELRLYKQFLRTASGGLVYYYPSKIVYGDESPYRYEKVGSGNGKIKGGGKSWNKASMDRVIFLLTYENYQRFSGENEDSWIARALELPQMPEISECPSCHGQQRQWERDRSRPRLLDPSIYDMSPLKKDFSPRFQSDADAIREYLSTGN